VGLVLSFKILTHIIFFVFLLLVLCFFCLCFLLSAVRCRWDHEVKSFVLPFGLEMTLGDISTGSSTPKMVSKVLEWKKAKSEEANRLWETLGKENERVRELFEKLSEEYAANVGGYGSVMEQCAKTTHDKVLLLSSFFFPFFLSSFLFFMCVNSPLRITSLL